MLTLCFLSRRHLSALACLGIFLRLDANFRMVHESLASLCKKLLCVTGKASNNNLALIRCFHCAAALAKDSKSRVLLCQGGMVHAGLRFLSSKNLVWGVGGEICGFLATVAETEGGVLLCCDKRNRSREAVVYALAAMRKFGADPKGEKMLSLMLSCQAMRLISSLLR